MVTAVQAVLPTIQLITMANLTFTVPIQGKRPCWQFARRQEGQLVDR